MNTCPQNYMELLPYKYMRMINKKRKGDVKSACIQWLGDPGFLEDLVMWFIHKEATDAGIIALLPSGEHKYIKSTADIPTNATSCHRWYHIT